MTYKKEISINEYNELKKKYPTVDLSAVYTVISDEKMKENKEREKSFKVPKFLRGF